MKTDILQTTPEVSPRGEATVLLLDADYLTYLVGAISQSPDPSPDVAGQERKCLDEESDKWVWVDPMPLVAWRVDNEIDKIKDTFNSDNLEVHLTPSTGNFRDTLAVSRPYKGKRTGIRPYHYQNIRDYLVSEYGGKIADGCEADDMVCTRQFELHSSLKPSVIIGPDKDLDCMFGYHYVPTGRNKGLNWNTDVDAAYNFFGQMITGDSVDNIPGIPGRGPKFRDSLFRMYPDDYLDLAEAVYDAYYDKGLGESYIIEQGNLLHMRRHIDDTWHPMYDFTEGYKGLQEEHEICYLP